MKPEKPAFSSISRLATNAQNRLPTTPIPSVIANPRIGPVPSSSRISAVISVVMFASSSVDKDFSKPERTAASGDFPVRRSSLMRSKMITLASTVMPIVRMIPAIPGSVRTARKRTSAPKTISMFRISARFATTPSTR